MATIEQQYGARLKAFRVEALKMTQEEFAKELNVPQVYISRWETGVYEIPRDIIKLLSKKHKLNVDFYYGNGGSMQKDSKESALVNIQQLKSDIIGLTAELDGLKKDFLKLYAEFYAQKHGIES